MKAASDETFIIDKAPDIVPDLFAQPHKPKQRRSLPHEPNNLTSTSNSTTTVLPSNNPSDGHKLATQATIPPLRPRRGLPLKHTAARFNQHTTADHPFYDFRIGEEVMNWSQTNGIWQQAEFSNVLKDGNLIISIKLNTRLDPEEQRPKLRPRTRTHSNHVVT